MHITFEAFITMIMTLQPLNAFFMLTPLYTHTYTHNNEYMYTTFLLLYSVLFTLFPTLKGRELHMVVKTKGHLKSCLHRHY